MKPFIVIDLIFTKSYQVQDSPSWLRHTKIMLHSGRPSFLDWCLCMSIVVDLILHAFLETVELKSAFVSQMKLMLMILYYGWLASSIRFVLVNSLFFFANLFTCLTLGNSIFSFLNVDWNLIFYGFLLSSICHACQSPVSRLCFIILI